MSIPYKSELRSLQEFPADEEALGRALFRQLQIKMLQEEKDLAHFLLIDAEVVELITLHKIKGWVGDQHRLLSGLAGARDLQFCALILHCPIPRGIFYGAQPTGKWPNGPVVFLEQPNNQWWLGWQERDLMLEHPRVVRAVDGATKPLGLGGWFSRARREQLQAKHLLPENVIIH